MIPLPVAAFFGKWGVGLLLGALLLGVNFYAGKLHERAAHEKKQTKAIETARDDERAGNKIANTAGSDHSAELKQQLEKAHAELATLRAALPTVGDCPVSRRVVRLLDGQRVPGAAGSAGKPKPTTAPVETVPREKAGDGAAAEGEPVQCSAVIDHCAVNRVTVCEPNALQVERLQLFYENLKRQYNKSP